MLRLTGWDLPGVYMVTAGTYGKEHRFKGKERMDYFHDLLLETAAEFRWSMEAWAVFPNHYHFIAEAPREGADSLRTMLRKLHSVSAKWLNGRDSTPGRKVWHNFMETHIITEKSHLARLHYVHANAVHHKVAPVAESISVVFRGVVRAKFHPGPDQDSLRFPGGSFAQ